VECLAHLACGLVTVPNEMSRRGCVACDGVYLTVKGFMFMIRKEKSRINLDV
jgi:hypothetical protein